MRQPHLLHRIIAHCNFSRCSRWAHRLARLHQVFCRTNCRQFARAHSLPSARCGNPNAHHPDPRAYAARHYVRTIFVCTHAKHTDAFFLFSFSLPLFSLFRFISFRIRRTFRLSSCANFRELLHLTANCPPNCWQFLARALPSSSAASIADYLFFFFFFNYFEVRVKFPL